MQNSDSRALIVTAKAAGPPRPGRPRDIRVSAPFIVQLAASHAGIGPYRAYFREGPVIALALYRATDMSDRGRD